MTSPHTEYLIYQTLTKLDERGDNDFVTQAMSIIRVILDAERRGQALSADEAYITAAEAAAWDDE